MDDGSPLRRPKRQRAVTNYAKLAEGNFGPNGADEEHESDVEEPKPRRVRIAVPARENTLDQQKLLGLVLAYEDKRGEGRTGSGRRKAPAIRRLKVPAEEKATDLKVLEAENVVMHIRSEGFQAPVLVRRTPLDGPGKLGIKLPDKELTVEHLADVLGPDHLIATVDLATQSAGPSYDMAQWESYWADTSSRHPLLCGEALDLAETPLAQVVALPEVVSELDLVNKVWPADKVRLPKQPHKLSVEMNPAGTFRDFHILFGGASHWQHVLRGRKVVLVAPPSPANLQAYEEWVASKTESYTFLAESLADCQKVDLRQGDTLLLPGGWIRCEATSVDSTLLAGSFLTGSCLKQQVATWSMESRMKVPSKQRYPHFKSIHWHATRWYVKQLTTNEGAGGSSADVSQWEKEALPVLVSALKSWLRQSREGREASGCPWSPKEAAAEVAALEVFFPAAPPPAPAPRSLPPSDSTSRIRLLIKSPPARGEGGWGSASASTSTARGRRRAAKKKDEDFVTGDELEEELGSNGSEERDGEEGEDDNEGEVALEDEEVREEDLDQVSDDDELPEVGAEEDEEDWGSARGGPSGKPNLVKKRALPGHSKPQPRQVASPRPAPASPRPPPPAEKKKAVRRVPSSVRERLLAKIGMDHRIPLPAPQKYTRPLVKKAQPGEAPSGAGGSLPSRPL